MPPDGHSRQLRTGARRKRQSDEPRDRHSLVWRGARTRGKHGHRFCTWHGGQRRAHHCQAFPRTRLNKHRLAQDAAENKQIASRNEHVRTAALPPLCRGGTVGHYGRPSGSCQGRCFGASGIAVTLHCKAARTDRIHRTGVHRCAGDERRQHLGQHSRESAACRQRRVAHPAQCRERNRQCAESRG